MIQYPRSLLDVHSYCKPSTVSEFFIAGRILPQEVGCVMRGTGATGDPPTSAIRSARNTFGDDRASNSPNRAGACCSCGRKLNITYSASDAHRSRSCRRRAYCGISLHRSQFPVYHRPERVCEPILISAIPAQHRLLLDRSCRPARDEAIRAAPWRISHWGCASADQSTKILSCNNAAQNWALDRVFSKVKGELRCAGARHKATAASPFREICCCLLPSTFITLQSHGNNYVSEISDGKRKWDGEEGRVEEVRLTLATARCAPRLWRRRRRQECASTSEGAKADRRIQAARERCEDESKL